MNTNAVREKVSTVVVEVSFLLRKAAGAVRHLTKASPDSTLASKLVYRLIGSHDNSPDVSVEVAAVRSMIASVILAEAQNRAQDEDIQPHERFSIDVDAIDLGYSKVPGALDEVRLQARQYGLVMGVVEGSNVFFRCDSGPAS